jgi:cytochrome c oxidase subunit 2
MLDWLPEAASSYAGDIDQLFILITVIVGVFFLLAEAALVFFSLRYRRTEKRKAAYIPARTLRSMAYVLVPCAVVLGFDLVIDAAAAPVWNQVKQTLPVPDERVRIQGEQWAWRFTYPGPDGQFDTADDFQTVNDFHVPLDAVVVFELTSKDVLHSLWMPALRLKQDAVPGRMIRGWFKATREGRYEVPCAEICGFGHTLMKATLVVETPAAYREWLRSKQAAPVGAARSRDEAQPRRAGRPAQPADNPPRLAGARSRAADREERG